MPLGRVCQHLSIFDEKFFFGAKDGLHPRNDDGLAKLLIERGVITDASSNRSCWRNCGLSADSESDNAIITSPT
jgi:hypothetical protein